MAILNTGNTFSGTDTVTSTKLNNIANGSDFLDASGNPVDSSGTTGTCSTDGNLEVSSGGQLQLKDTVALSGTNNQLSQTTTQSIVNDNRPVGTQLQYKAQPTSGGVQQTTDYHGVDILAYTSGANVGSGSAIRLYPFESTARHNTDDTINGLVSGYLLWLNTQNGDVESARGLRMWGKNQGTGTIESAKFISIEKPENSGGGEIQNLRGIVIEEMSDTFTDAKGLDIAETQNYIAGLEVGDLTITGSFNPKSAGIDKMVNGVRFEAGAGFAVTNGINLGTSSFTWSRIISLDDYTPSSDSVLWSSHSSGNSRVEIKVLTTGVFRLSFTDGSGTVSNYDFSNANLVDRSSYRITIACSRSGNATLYVGSSLVGTVNVSASSTVDVGNGNTNSSVFWTDANLSGADGGGFMFNYAINDISSRINSIDFLNSGDRWDLVDSEIYSSDFTSTNDGFNGTRSVTVANQTVGAVSGALKVYKDGANGGSYINKTGAYTAGDSFTVTCDVYIPSTNTNTDGVQFKFNNNGYLAYDARSTQANAIAADTWTTVTFNVSSESGWTNNLQVAMTDGNSASWQGLNDPNDDVFYIKNYSIFSNGAILHHPMNDGSGAIINDASTNNLDGTATGTYYHLLPS